MRPAVVNSICMSQHHLSRVGKSCDCPARCKKSGVWCSPNLFWKVMRFGAGFKAQSITKCCNEYVITWQAVITEDCIAQQESNPWFLSAIRYPIPWGSVAALISMVTVATLRLVSLQKLWPPNGGRSSEILDFLFPNYLWDYGAFSFFHMHKSLLKGMKRFCEPCRPCSVWRYLIRLFGVIKLHAILLSK